MTGLLVRSLRFGCDNRPFQCGWFAIVLELIPWPPRPLTVAETRLAARAGIEPTHGRFLVRILDAMVHRNLPVRPEHIVTHVSSTNCHPCLRLLNGIESFSPG